MFRDRLTGIGKEKLMLMTDRWCSIVFRLLSIFYVYYVRHGPWKSRLNPWKVLF